MTLVQILICAYVVKLINFIICCMMVHPPKEYFLYFAYGSNLLKKRIRINNPSAEFMGIGLLDVRSESVYINLYTIILLSLFNLFIR